jgi:hypothetical protein
VLIDKFQFVATLRVGFSRQSTISQKQEASVRSWTKSDH